MLKWQRDCFFWWQTPAYYMWKCPPARYWTPKWLPKLYWRTVNFLCVSYTYISHWMVISLMTPVPGNTGATRRLWFCFWSLLTNISSWLCLQLIFLYCLLETIEQIECWSLLNFLNTKFCNRIFCFVSTMYNVIRECTAYTINNIFMFIFLFSLKRGLS